MKPKGTQDAKEQQFQDLIERCERIEKMIHKMGEEHRYYCQNCNEMISFSTQSAPEVGKGLKLSESSQDDQHEGIIHTVTQPSLEVFESQM